MRNLAISPLLQDSRQLPEHVRLHEEFIRGPGKRSVQGGSQLSRHYHPAFDWLVHLLGLCWVYESDSDVALSLNSRPDLEGALTRMDRQY